MSTADDEWVVRPVTGSSRGTSSSSRTRAYRCPGCDQEVRPGTPHLVVWPAWPEGDAGVEDRRHWHTACWGARGRRGPKVQRSRNGPRY